MRLLELLKTSLNLTVTGLFSFFFFGIGFKTALF